MRIFRFGRLITHLSRIADRAFHARRRGRTLARLQTDRAPRTVLVVCTGNVCRSPYAAAALRRALGAAGDAVTIESAGFSTPNRPPPPLALAVAASRGIDLEGHRSRAVSPAVLDKADLIVVMDARQGTAVQARSGANARRVIVLGDLDPQPIGVREIADPFGQPRAAFEACYERIDRCMEGLARAITRSQ